MRRINASFYEFLGWSFVLLAFVPLFFTRWLLPQLQDPALGGLSNVGEWVGGITAPFLNLAGFVMIYVAFRQQARDGEAQQFDQTFFQLLNLHHQNHTTIQSSFRHGGSGSNNFFQHTREFLSRGERGKTEREVFEAFYAKQYDHIDLFVRHVLFAARYVLDNHLLQPRHRAQYLELLRTQLSTDELFLLRQYCMHRGPADAALADLFQRLKTENFFERQNQAQAQG